MSFGKLALLSMLLPGGDLAPDGEPYLPPARREPPPPRREPVPYTGTAHAYRNTEAWKRAEAKRARKAAKLARDIERTAEGRANPKCNGKSCCLPLARWDYVCFHQTWSGPLCPALSDVDPLWRQRLNRRRARGPIGRTAEERERHLAWRDGYTYAAPGVVVDEIVGYCPIQGYGTVDGWPFYFRARGSHWSFEVGERMGEHLPEPTVWGCEAHYGPTYAAGWMSPAHVRKCLDAAIAAFRSRGEVTGWTEMPPSKSVPKGRESYCRPFGSRRRR